MKKTLYIAMFVACCSAAGVIGFLVGRSQPSHEEPTAEPTTKAVPSDDALLSAASQANIACLWLQALDNKKYDALQREMLAFLVNRELVLTAFVEEYPNSPSVDLATNVLARIRPVLEQHRSAQQRQADQMTRGLMRAAQDQGKGSQQ